MSLPRVSD